MEVTSSPGRLMASVEVAANAERTWEALISWDRQGDWIVATTVRATTNGGYGVGGGIEARTGIGPLGVVDTMTITGWDPPHSCVVAHTGRFLRGEGEFRVVPLGERRSRVLWIEWLRLPFGPLGHLGWLVVQPFALSLLRLSLHRFAHQVGSARKGG